VCGGREDVRSNQIIMTKIFGKHPFFKTPRRPQLAVFVDLGAKCGGKPVVGGEKNA